MLKRKGAGAGDANQESTLARFRASWSPSSATATEKMRAFNQRLEHTMWFSGSLILIARCWRWHIYPTTILSVRGWLNALFSNPGGGAQSDWAMLTPLFQYGEDELGRIGKLLRHTPGRAYSATPAAGTGDRPGAEDRSPSAYDPGMSWFRRPSWRSSGRR